MQRAQQCLKQVQKYTTNTKDQDRGWSETGLVIRRGLRPQDWKHFYNITLAVLTKRRMRSKSADHSESDVCFLERRSVICTISSDGDDLAVGVETTVNDAFHQRVLVLRR